MHGLCFGYDLPRMVEFVSAYLRIVNAGVVEYLQAQAGMRVNRGTYCTQVVLWLMMVQRLQGRGTVASAVQRIGEPSSRFW